MNRLLNQLMSYCDSHKPSKPLMATTIVLCLLAAVLMGGATVVASWLIREMIERPSK